MTRTHSFSPILSVAVLLCALVALLAPGAVADQIAVVGTLDLPNQSVPLAQRPAALPGLTFRATFPPFQRIGPNGEVRTLNRVIYVPCLTVGGVTTVTNTSSTPWSWGQFSAGFSLFGAFGDAPLGPDANNNPAPHFGGQSAVMLTCAWSSLDAGEMAQHSAEPVAQPWIVDYVGPTERWYSDPGTKTVTFTLGAEHSEAGLSGHWSATSDVRVGKFDLGAPQLVVLYDYTVGASTSRHRVVELPWTDAPTVCSMDQLTGPYTLGEAKVSWMRGWEGDPSRVRAAFVETTTNGTVNYGIEHVGQGPATCSGNALGQVYSLIDGDMQDISTWPTATWASGANSCQVGTFTQTLGSFDGLSDWQGTSGIERLTRLNQGWGSYLVPMVRVESALQPLIRVDTAWEFDTHYSRFAPTSAQPVAWDAQQDLRTRHRLVLELRPLR